MTAAAAMRDYVSLLRSVPTDDARFGTTAAFQPYAKVWATVLPMTGTTAGAEEFVQMGVQSVVNYTATIRYRGDVTNTDRILYRGKTLELLSAVDPDGKRSTLNIIARENVGVVS
jgi:SPP1 family predicted phage head-tail adaptor